MASSSRFTIGQIVAAGAGAVLMAALVRRRRRKMDFSGKSVVIAGGSRGLGLEIARLLAREGAELSLVARDQGELERARDDLAGLGANVEIFACDLRNRQEIRQAIHLIIGSRGKIDVLINDAGIVQVSPYDNLDLDDFEEAMAVHAWGPLHLIRGVVPHMRRQGGGRIVNISSIGGLVAVPHMLPYCMSKFALTGLSDGLRAELARDNILVTTVAPGFMRTGSHVNGFFKGQHRKEFAWFAIAGASPLLSTSVRAAARRVIAACRYGRPRLIITIPATLFHLMNANFPGLVSGGMKLVARLMPEPSREERHRLYTGWESRSRIAPAASTWLADRMIPRNNEVQNL